MSYTHTPQQKQTGMHRVRIEPLNPSIVRFALTIQIGGYPNDVSDELLSLYAALALTGTKTKNKEDIEKYLKRYGISLKVSARRAAVTFKGSVRKENVVKAVKLLREIILSLRIDTSEFERKKKLAFEDNRESRDDAKRIAGIVFSNLLYDRESIMRDPTLEEELSAIRRIKKNNLEKFVAALPQNEWYLSVVCSKGVESEFDTLMNVGKSKAREVVYPVLEVRAREAESMFITIPGKTNVEVRIGNIIPITPDHEAYIPLEFGIAVLGKVGGFSGRLMSTVREKEGLTYGIYARTVESKRHNTIHWNIYTFFTGKDLEKGIQATRREISRIVSEGITDKELATFKEILGNQIILNHESNATRLSYYHGLSLMRYNEEDASTMYTRIMQLTAEEVNAALKTYIDPDKLVIVGAGPVRPDGTGITST